MTHSLMLKARRGKQKTKKRLAGIAKRAKKLKKQNVKMAGADASKREPPSRFAAVEPNLEMRKSGPWPLEPGIATKEASIGLEQK